MAKVKKAVKKFVKAAKPEKKKKVKPKPKITARQVYEIIAETLQANSEGEFDLPSMMTRYLDKSDPRSKLGLHREYYIPPGNIPFYSNTSEKAMTLYRNQASTILPALAGEGIKLRIKKFDLPLCEEHRD